MIDASVGEYCKDDGKPHEWEMTSHEGCIRVDCRCGARAAEFVGQWAMEIENLPVSIRFPKPWECEDTPWLDIRQRL